MFPVKCLVQLWHFHASVSQDISWPPECVTLQRFRCCHLRENLEQLFLDYCSILPDPVNQNIYFSPAGDLIQEISVLFLALGFWLRHRIHLTGFNHWIQVRKKDLISLSSLIEAYDSSWKFILIFITCWSEHQWFHRRKKGIIKYYNFLPYWISTLKVGYKY